MAGWFSASGTTITRKAREARLMRADTFLVTLSLIIHIGLNGELFYGYRIGCLASGFQ